MHIFKYKLKNTNLFNYTTFSFCHALRNLTANIEDKLPKKLYLQENHPIGIIKSKISNFFHESNRLKWSKLNNLNSTKFNVFENLPQIVSTAECFDNLLVDKDNETRSPKNTYYVDDSHILRTHMTAFDIPLIKAGNMAFYSVGDVFRRDSIDNTHYPIFHQVDAVRLFDIKELPLTNNPYDCKNDFYEIILHDLKYFLENLMK